MTQASPNAHVDLAAAFVERPLSSCVELVFLTSAGAAPPHPWNAAPGSALAFSGDASAMNIAPGRWLLVGADARAMADATAAGAVVVDVEGKWRCFVVSGSRAAALIAAGVNVEVVLDGRACAPVLLFDCPAVIARGASDTHFDIYVSASYSSSLCAALERARQSAARS